MNIGRLKRNNFRPETSETSLSLRSHVSCLGSSSGFTLLEIMVAVAILSISLVALLNFQGNTMIRSGRAEKITEATMLARMKMAELDLELDKLSKRGEFPEEKAEEGNFEEPFASYRWKYSISNVNLPAPISGDEGSIQNMIGRQLSEEIAKNVREVKLEVFWEELGEEQSIDVVTHIVKL